MLMLRSRHFLISIVPNSKGVMLNYKISKLSLHKMDTHSYQYFSPEGRVLVHCRQGRSRSAAIVVAFLMMYRGMTAAAALTMIRKSMPE